MTRLMGGSSLNEKENDKHVTDRFIPIRRAHSNRVEKFGEEIGNESQKNPKRGQ